MFGDLWNLYASQVWCEQKLDMMAWIERPSLKLWDQKWTHAFTTGLIITLNICLNCFSFCRVLAYPTSLGYLDAKYKQQLTKEKTWVACEVATECFLFRIQTGSRPSSGIQGLVWMRPVLQPPVSFLCVRPQMHRTMAHYERNSVHIVLSLRAKNVILQDATDLEDKVSHCADWFYSVRWLTQTVNGKTGPCGPQTQLFVCEVGWIWLANLTEYRWFTWIATATFYSKGHWCWYSTCSFFMKQGLVCSLSFFSSTPLARPKDWSVCQFTCGEGEENRAGKGLQEGSAVTTWSKAVLLASSICTHSNILHSMFTCF